MTARTVYQTDRSGTFIGTTVADESPREPGVYLIPAGAIETPPPEIPEGQVARWNGVEWQLITAPN